jgi:protein SCO1
MTRTPFLRLLTLAAVLCVALSAEDGRAKPVDPSERIERKELLPKRLENIDVVEHPNADIPRELEFMDDTGRPVKLGSYFDGKLPVILTLNYSSCPMLCSLILNGMVTALKEVDLTAGKDFRIVTVSLDPAETPATAARTKDRYLSHYGRPEARQGWHFLTGSEQSIQALAHTVGVRYGYNEKRKEYVHPAVLTLVTPQGRVARYLYGIEFLPKTLRLSLLETSEGKIGTTFDRLILYCFHYDASEGRYAPAAVNIMRLGGGLTAALLAGFLATMWMGELRKKRRALAAGPEPEAPSLSHGHERQAT